MASGSTETKKLGLGDSGAPDPAIGPDITMPRPRQNPGRRSRCQPQRRHEDRFNRIRHILHDSFVVHPFRWSHLLAHPALLILRPAAVAGSVNERKQRAHRVDTGQPLPVDAAKLDGPRDGRVGAPATPRRTRTPSARHRSGARPPAPSPSPRTPSHRQVPSPCFTGCGNSWTNRATKASQASGSDSTSVSSSPQPFSREPPLAAAAFTTARGQPSAPAREPHSARAASLIPPAAGVRTAARLIGHVQIS